MTGGSAHRGKGLWKGTAFRFSAVKCFSFRKGEKATVPMVVMKTPLLWLMVDRKKMRASESPYIAQVGLELVVVPLPLPPECLDYKNAPLCSNISF